MLAPSVVGPIAPVGPTSFEFVVPDDAPLTLAPSVGTVMPGKVSSQSVVRCKHNLLTAQLIYHMYSFSIQCSLYDLSASLQ